MKFRVGDEIIAMIQGVKVRGTIKYTSKSLYRFRRGARIVVNELLDESRKSPWATITQGAVYWISTNSENVQLGKMRIEKKMKYKTPEGTQITATLKKS